MRAETKLTRPKTKTRMEPGRKVSTGSRVSHRPGGDCSRAGAAVTKLRDVSFHESEDWWGLLAAVSRECGFSLTRIEERCER